jgi:hypothetical protein
MRPQIHCTPILLLVNQIVTLRAGSGLFLHNAQQPALLTSQAS